MRHIFSIFILSLLCGGCSDDYDLPSGTNDVVTWMDETLSEMYLYNDEYNSMNRDLSLSYDSFLGATLKSMTTNVLDYKDGSIYSYITRAASTKSGETRLSNSKSKEASLGIALLGGIEYPNTKRMELAVYAVYKDSPMYEAGLRRGDIIKAVNGATIYESTYATVASMLLYPTVGEIYTIMVDDGTEHELVAESIYCSPILVSEVWDVEDKKVGYLSYLSFDAAYDTDLKAALREFKTEGVTDMILDMRFNGGGYVNSANILATAIAGSASSGKVFTYYTYNPTRGKAYVSFLSNQSDCDLNLSNLYCIVSEYTASASELVINSLEGIDIPVTLIGSTTEGKNVAMEVSYYTYGSYDYTFAPITILLSNAKDEGDYADGMPAEYERDDWYNGYNFADFTQEEVMIWTALDLIKGGMGEPEPTAKASTTRSGDYSVSCGKIFRAEGIKSGNIVNIAD